MIDSKQILQMAEGLQDIVTAIKDGEVTVQEMKDALPGMADEATKSFDMILDVVNEVPNDDLDLVTRTSIKLAIQKSLDDYDAAEHAKAAEMAMEIAKSADADIGEPLIVPMLSDLMVNMIPMLKVILPDSVEVVRETVNKYV